MAYGKGTFTAHDKVLPGMYVNVKSEAEIGSNIGDRGKVAIALELDWGNDADEIIKITAKDFSLDGNKIFGYAPSHEKMLVLREIFKGATEVYVYRLNGVGGVKASSDGFAIAKYAGVRGNDIKIVVSPNVDDTAKFDVVTMLGDAVVDRQIKVDATSVKDNDFVDFLRGESFALSEGTKVLNGGTNATSVGIANHNTFLNKLESYQVNIVGCISEDASIQAVYATWVKSQRDVYGNCIQAVLYNQAADHEGIINVDDSVALIPWVMGKEAGCPLNSSIQNIIYDGEVVPVKDYTQSDLEIALLNGRFVIHRVGESFRVLADINSLVTITEDKSEDFKFNQTIRVIDQLNVDAGTIWGEAFIGKVPNTDNGRNLFWGRITSLLNEYVALGAIEPYNKELVTVSAGTQRGSLVLQMPVQVASMLEKAYVTIVVQ